MKFLRLLFFLIPFILYGCVTDTSRDIIDGAIKAISIPSSVSCDLELPVTIIFNEKEVSVEWISKSPTVIENNGTVHRQHDSNIDVVLTATIRYNDSFEEVDYIVTVLSYTPTEILQQVIDTIVFPPQLLENLILPTSYAYGISATWQSSDESILTNDGIVFLEQKGKVVELILTLSLGGVDMEKKFIFVTQDYQSHFIIDRIDDFDDANMFNLIAYDKFLAIDKFELQGFYESNVYETENVKSIVASWSAETSTEATVELMIRVRVDGVWSDYLSYSAWGLGLENAGRSVVSINKVAKISYDEIIINDNKVSSAIQYKVILHRKTVETDSPKLKLVALALEIPLYSYSVDATNLPVQIDYDVPKLNQNTVPGIGNSICSPTSTTMLLKFKGHNFQEKDSFEHRYIAGLAKDYGHNIYGNWVYNTAVMGALGEISFVKRMYSLDELKLHLATIGPVAASVKGNMEGLYNTSGHLIVIRGYKIVDDKLYFICNDPNLANVYYEYQATTIQNVWRNIVYIIE